MPSKAEPSVEVWPEQLRHFPSLFLLLISYELAFNIGFRIITHEITQSTSFRQSDEPAYYKTSEKNHPLASQMILKTVCIKSK